MGRLEVFPSGPPRRSRKCPSTPDAGQEKKRGKSILTQLEPTHNTKTPKNEKEILLGYSLAAKLENEEGEGEKTKKWEITGESKEGEN